jgi:DNA-binding LytR/AlgR family response regulator
MNSAELSRLAAELFSVMRHWKQEKKILLRSKTETRVVALKDIQRLHTGGHVTMVYIKLQSEFSSCRTLDSFEADLNDYYFFRVHDNCIVNLLQVERYVPADNLITMKDGTLVDASRRRFPEFVARLEELP